MCSQARSSIGAARSARMRTGWTERSRTSKRDSFRFGAIIASLAATRLSLSCSSGTRSSTSSMNTTRCFSACFAAMQPLPSRFTPKGRHLTPNWASSRIYDTSEAHCRRTRRTSRHTLVDWFSGTAHNNSAVFAGRPRVPKPAAIRGAA